jgi:hypothetical protein
MIMPKAFQNSRGFGWKRPEARRSEANFDVLRRNQEDPTDAKKA